MGQGGVDDCDFDEAGAVGNGLRDIEGDDGLGSVYNQLRQRGGQLTTYEELRQGHGVSSKFARHHHHAPDEAMATLTSKRVRRLWIGYRSKNMIVWRYCVRLVARKVRFAR